VESDSVNGLEEAWHYLLARLPEDLIVKTEGGVADASIPNCKSCATVFPLSKGKGIHHKINVTLMGWLRRSCPQPSLVFSNHSER